MSVQETKLAAIADAIREREGSTGPIPAGDFAARILALPGGSLPDNVRTITVSANNPEWGTVEGGGVASDGMTIQVHAEPAMNRSFKLWKEADKEISLEKTILVPVSKDIELTAEFVSGPVVAGSNWWEGTIGNTSDDWDDITFGKGIFVAVGPERKTAYSEDGVIWKYSDISYQNLGWNKVQYGNGIFVALSYNTGKAAYSTDGINWTTVSLPYSDLIWNSLCYGNGVFVAGANNTTTRMIYSKNGKTWGAGTTLDNYAAPEIAYGNGKFVACASGYRFYYSENGITWSQGEWPDFFRPTAIAYGMDKFVLFYGLSYNRQEKIAYSADGITWVSQDFVSPDLVSPLIFADNKFVALKMRSAKGLYSTDGVTWDDTDIIPDYWDNIAYGNGMFVAVGPNGKSLYSYSS